MSALRKVASNALSLSAAQVINPISAIFLLGAIARTEGVSGVGQYSLVLALFYMAANFGGLGLRTPVTRAVSRAKDRVAEYTGVLLATGLVTGTLAALAVVALVRLLNYDSEIVSAMNILAFAVVPAVWFLHFEAIFIAYQKAQRIAAISILENLFKVVGGLTLLAMGYGTLSIIVLVAVLRIVALIAIFISYTRLPHAGLPKFSAEIAKELMLVAPVFATNLLLSAPFARFDFILLSKFGTIADVGLYSAALRLINVASFIPQSVKASILPTFCETLPRSKSEFLELFNKAFSYLAAYGIGAALGFVVLGQVFLLIIYGDQFLAAGSIMNILAITLLFGSTSSALTAALFAANHEKLDLISNVTRVAAMLITLSITIPIWGLPGAGYGMVIASIVHFSLSYMFVSKRMFFENVFSHYSLPLVAGIAGLLVWYISNPLPPIASGILGMTVYVAVLFTLDAPIRNDLIATAKANNLIK